MTVEQPLVFGCGGQQLVGILSLPATTTRRGVLVVVGGPQYRVGSHRQFTLLARALAAAGLPVLRFDYAGMGDSDGAVKSFEHAATDIRCAIDAFIAAVPNVEEVVIWGLCDAASAASFYAAGDPRVTRLVLLNPWVRTEAGAAKAYLRGYYVARLLDANFWRKVARGEFDVRSSLGSLVTMLWSAFGRKPAAVITGADAPVDPPAPRADLPTRMLEGLAAFKGRILVILSGDDRVAAEFRNVVAASRRWRRLMGAKRVAQRRLDEADHTFSSRLWRDQVARWTIDWLQE